MSNEAIYRSIPTSWPSTVVDWSRWHAAPCTPCHGLYYALSWCRFETIARDNIRLQQIIAKDEPEAWQNSAGHGISSSPHAITIPIMLHMALTLDNITHHSVLPIDAVLCSCHRDDPSLCAGAIYSTTVWTHRCMQVFPLPYREGGEQFDRDATTAERMQAMHAIQWCCIWHTVVLYMTCSGAVYDMQ